MKKRRPVAAAVWGAHRAFVGLCLKTISKVSKIFGETPESTRLYEDDMVYAFEDINPISQGHTLIIPKTHAENLWEISEEDLTAIHRASKKLVHAMTSAIKPDGVAVLQLNGRAVNQEVMHYHLHLIPRKSGTPELKMTRWDLTPGDMDAIGATAEKIAGALAE